MQVTERLNTASAVLMIISTCCHGYLLPIHIVRNFRLLLDFSAIKPNDCVSRIPCIAWSSRRSHAELLL